MSYDPLNSGELDQRTFDLWDIELKTKIAEWFGVREWRDHISEEQLNAAIASASADRHTITLTRWKKIPTAAFQKLNADQP